MPTHQPNYPIWITTSKFWLLTLTLTLTLILAFLNLYLTETVQLKRSHAADKDILISNSIRWTWVERHIQQRHEIWLTNHNSQKMSSHIAQVSLKTSTGMWPSTSINPRLRRMHWDVSSNSRFILTKLGLAETLARTTSFSSCRNIWVTAFRTSMRNWQWHQILSCNKSRNIDSLQVNPNTPIAQPHSQCSEQLNATNMQLRIGKTLPAVTKTQRKSDEWMNVRWIEWLKWKYEPPGYDYDYISAHAGTKNLPAYPCSASEWLQD